MMAFPTLTLDTSWSMAGPQTVRHSCGVSCNHTNHTAEVEINKIYHNYHLGDNKFVIMICRHKLYHLTVTVANLVLPFYACAFRKYHTFCRYIYSDVEILKAEIGTF